MPLVNQRVEVPVTIDASLCIDGCTLCVDVCPLDSLAIDEVDQRIRQALRLDGGARKTVPSPEA